MRATLASDGSPEGQNEGWVHAIARSLATAHPNDMQRDGSREPSLAGDPSPEGRDQRRVHASDSSLATVHPKEPQ